MGLGMVFLCTGDLHLTDNPRDSYRWGIFPWMYEESIKHDVSQILLLGDVTDSKDNHGSSLVNQLVDSLMYLASRFDVYWLRGNHDCLNENLPYFKFLGELDKNIHYINVPTKYYLTLGKNSIKCLFLPSTRNYEKDWAGLEDWNEYSYVFCHQTFTGARSESGIQLTGVPPSLFKGFKGRVVAGDIHVPQDINKTITQCGSPFHVRFGDSFIPRVLLLGDKPTRSSTDLRFPCLSKHTLVVTSAEELLSEAVKHNVKEGDQVKVRVRLPRTQYGDWNQIKEQIRITAVQKGWDLFGPELLPLSQREKAADSVSTYRSPEAILKDYAKQKRFNEAQIAAGLRLLN